MGGRTPSALVDETDEAKPGMVRSTPLDPTAATFVPRGRSWGSLQAAIDFRVEVLRRKQEAEIEEELAKIREEVRRKRRERVKAQRPERRRIRKERARALEEEEKRERVRIEEEAQKQADIWRAKVEGLGKGIEAAPAGALGGVELYQAREWQTDVPVVEGESLAGRLAKFHASKKRAPEERSLGLARPMEEASARSEWGVSEVDRTVAASGPSNSGKKELSGAASGSGPVFKKRTRPKKTEGLKEEVVESWETTTRSNVEDRLATLRRTAQARRKPRGF